MFSSFSSCIHICTIAAVVIVVIVAIAGHIVVNFVFRRFFMVFTFYSPIVLCHNWANEKQEHERIDKQLIAGKQPNWIDSNVLLFFAWFLQKTQLLREKGRTMWIVTKLHKIWNAGIKVGLCVRHVCVWRWFWHYERTAILLLLFFAKYMETHAGKILRVVSTSCLWAMFIWT